MYTENGPAVLERPLADNRYIRRSFSTKMDLKLTLKINRWMSNLL